MDGFRGSVARGMLPRRRIFRMGSAGECAGQDAGEVKDGRQSARRCNYHSMDGREWQVVISERVIAILLSILVQCFGD